MEAESSTSSVYLDITVKATTDFLNAFLDTIIVSLTNLENGEMPISQHLGHNGMAVYSINSSSQLGTYRALFAEEDSNKWDCGAVLYNYNVPTTRSLREREQNFVVNDDKTRFYLIPSSLEETIALCNTNNLFSVDDLYNQFYDNELKDFVYSLRNFSVGDIIVVEDMI